MTDKIIELLIPVIVAGFLFKLWFEDFRNRGTEQASPKPIPGAMPASLKVVIIGVVGALILLAVETGGEIALGISSEQKVISYLFVIPILCAAISEEVIFRGFLVVNGRGRAPLVGSIIGFSLIFALIHDFLWTFDMPEGVDGWKVWEGTFTLHLDAKGFFSTALVFLNSLWFYALRFMPANREHSLIPCFVAHAASNLGVFIVKWAQGFVQGII